MIDAHLNPDESINDIDEIDNMEVKSFDDNDDLIISSVLNLDTSAFVKNLDKIIDDNEDINMKEEVLYITSIIFKI